MNHIFTVALILWVASGAAYRRARRGDLSKVTITPLSIEDQLDAAIHFSQVRAQQPLRCSYELCSWCNRSTS